MALADPVLLGTSETTILTVPAGKNYAVVLLSLTNNSSSSIVAGIRVRKNGAAVGKSTTFIPELEIPAKRLLENGTTKLALSGGDVISGSASVGGEVSAFCSFVEIV